MHIPDPDPPLAGEAEREHEVEYDGTWYPARLEHWVVRDDGTRWAHVSLQRGAGRFLDTVPEERVRRAALSD
jgi:hypothetical protein